MYVNGFRGQVYSTSATAQLCEIMLRDSAHIQMFEAEWRNRKAARSGGKLKEFVPLYDMDAAVNVCKQFVGCEYDRYMILQKELRLDSQMLDIFLVQRVSRYGQQRRQRMVM